MSVATPSASATLERVAERTLERAKALGASQADVVAIESESREARVRGEAIDFVKQAGERGLGIRVMMDRSGNGSGEAGRSTAVTSTSDLSDEAIDRLVEETIAIANATAADPFAGLPEEPSADPAALPDLELFDAADRNVDIEARIDDAFRAEAAARETDARIANSEGSQVGSDTSRIVFAHSGGFLASYESGSHSLFSEPLAKDGEAMQRDYWMTSAHRLADLEDAGAVGRRAAQRALRRLGAKQIETCEVPVIFDEVTAPSLWRQLAGCISGYSIYRESSFLADKLGETIAAPAVTVIDDGRLPGGFGSKPFDGEGLATRRNVVVDGGRLQSWLLDSYSARKLGMQSTGNASRGIGSTPGVGATNLWLEPGDAGSLDAMIAATERGLLVTELIGMGFNPVTGDYSRGAAGLWIENGEIAHPVEEITIAANFADMLTSIDAIGSELVWLGKVASPPLRIANMTIAGA